MSNVGQYQALVVGSGGWAGCRALCPGGGTGQNQPGGGLIMECTLYTALWCAQIELTLLRLLIMLIMHTETKQTGNAKSCNDVCLCAQADHHQFALLHLFPLTIISVSNIGEICPGFHSLILSQNFAPNLKKKGSISPWIYKSKPARWILAAEQSGQFLRNPHLLLPQKPTQRKAGGKKRLDVHLYKLWRYARSFCTGRCVWICKIGSKEHQSELDSASLCITLCIKACVFMGVAQQNCALVGANMARQCCVHGKLVCMCYAYWRWCCAYWWWQE